MAFFYKQYFTCLSIGGSTALITFLCIFFLSKEGWQKSNNALVNLSVTSFAVTTFYLNLTQMFQQDQNLKASQDLYADYSALRNDFNSSLVLAIPQASKPTIKTSALDTIKRTTYFELIQNTDYKLNKLGYIRLGFDPTSITEIQGKANSFLGASGFQSTTQPVKNPK